MLQRILLISYCLMLCFSNGLSAAQTTQEVENSLESYRAVFLSQLGSVKNCEQAEDKIFRVCSDKLRNEGNAPYIMHHGKKTKKVVILFHGLTDSPFFYRSIAPAFHQQGYNVVVSLLPAHGLKDADKAITDPKLKALWINHVAAIIKATGGLGDKIYLGGFSTGGALSVHHILKHPESIDGLLLFSGALELGSAPEYLYGNTGTRKLAKAIDSNFESEGPSPYRYPMISAYGGIVLLDVIHEIREQLDAGDRLKLPVFAAHSESDTTCMLSGIEYLLARNEGSNKIFVIDEKYEVCHADLVVNQAHVDAMEFDESQILWKGDCVIPVANPLHGQMLKTAVEFLNRN